MRNVAGKSEKTQFSHTFRGTTTKISKTLFFNIFCELCTKCLEKRERTLFSHTLCITSRKKTLFLNFFCELCTKCLEKREKTRFFTLFAERRVKSSKNAVFSYSMRTLYKVSRKTWKNTVFSHFLRNVA